jgi:dethiobiotin synthetase
MTRKGLFVTGTDTGVGKTAVTAALAGALRRRGIDAGVMKPIQTGAIRSSGGLIAPDARFLAAAAGVIDPPDLICPCRLETPLAPAVAAKLEDREVSLASVLAAYHELLDRHGFLLVEGAGGICVPISGTYLMSDLARDMGLPLLVVARPSLGTINHSVLTAHFARAAGLEVLGVVIGNYPKVPDLAERTSPVEIERLTGVPVLGIFNHEPSVDVEGGETGEIVTRMEGNPILDRLLALLRD